MATEIDKRGIRDVLLVALTISTGAVDAISWLAPLGGVDVHGRVNFLVVSRVDGRCGDVGCERAFEGFPADREW
jgi:hypothetical protein